MITAVPYTRPDRCVAKVQYRKRQHAERWLTYFRKTRYFEFMGLPYKAGKLQVYRCNVCAQFHLGHRPESTGV